MKVLLVQTASEGEKTLQALLSSGSKISMDGIHAPTLSDGLKQLNFQTFDAIVADLFLPDSQGLDTLVQIQRHTSHQTPIIVIVGNDNQELAIQALESGADDYLLREKIDGWLLGRSLQQVKERKAIKAKLDATQQELAAYKEQTKISLEHSSERLAAIIELAPDAIISIDADQRITLFNPGAVNIFGYDASEAIGQPLDLLLPEILVAIHRQYVNQFQQSGDTKRQMGKSLEIVACRKDGTKFPAEASINKVTVENEIILTVILRDISDRKQAEAALQASRNELETCIIERTAELEKANNAYRAEIKERKRTEQALQDIVTGTASVTGSEFFPALVRHLAQALDVRYALATEILPSEPEQLQVLAWWNHRCLGENFKYPIKATPCEIVHQSKQLCYYPRGVQELFPDDPDLVKMGAVCYIGVPLLDTEAETIGHLCMLHNKPLTDVERTKSLLTVFAARATAELQRQNAQDKLRRTHDILELRVNERTAELSETLRNLEAQMAERQRVQLELLVANERLQHLLTSSPAIIFSCKAEENYPITFISENVKAIFGYNAQEFLDDAYFWIDRVHPEDVDLLLKQFPRLLRQGYQAQEYRWQHFDGSYRWFYGELKIVYDTANNPIECVGYWIDISDRKQTEADLEKERQQLRQIVTHAPVAMAMFDRQMCYIAYSNQWLIDYQLTSDHNPDIRSLEGCSHYEIFPNLPEQYKTMHQKALQGEVIYVPEYLFELGDGSKVYRRLAIQPWYVADETIGGIVIAYHTIHELVTARESALEIARMKSELLANMSHEIRTPMNGVIGMTELLDCTILTHQQRDFLQVLKASGENLLLIINDILDFSKIEAREMRLEVIEFNLDDILEETIDLFAFNAHKKNIELVSFISPDLPRKLKGDPYRLRQIISNLINNGIKFTQSGSVTIEIYSKPSIVPEKIKDNLRTLTLYVQVKDTGIGIYPEEQNKLFKAFSQVDASNTREYGGTGLGLAICKQLVELMGGEIGVQSVAGVGSTFWFTVPLEVGEVYPQNNTHIGDLNNTDRPNNLAGKKLLVVDDHPVNRLAIYTQATAWGMEVYEAANGEMALSMLRKAATDGYAYDLALLDLQMPEMNGETLGELILSESADLKTAAIAKTKLILMTSLESSEIASRVRQNNFAGYLMKPIKKTRLLDCLINVINQDNSILLKISEKLTVKAKDADDQSAETSQLNAMKILLVEDTPVNRTVALTQLKQLGYEADYVENGQEALDRLASQSYDLVLMDCQMPVLDGYQATRVLREREGENSHTVVVGLTAYAMKGDREKCLEAGMDDYLSKPVKLKQFAEIIEKWMPKKLPLINFSPWAKISGGDKKFKIQLLQAFIEHTEGYLTQIKEALVNSDAVVLAQLANQIKVSSANVGIPKISELAKQLQVTAEYYRLDSAVSLISDLDIYLQGVKADLPQLQGVRDNSDRGDRTVEKNYPLESGNPQEYRPQKKPDLNNIIDRDRLAQISRGNDKFIEQLIAAFIKNTETYLQEARTALSVNDTESLAHHAHNLKGSSGTVGVRLMPEIAQCLQQQAQQNQLQNAPQLLQELTEILEQVKNWQKNILPA